MEKKILDVTCGARSIWFNKHHPAAVYCDKRREQLDKVWPGCPYCKEDSEGYVQKFGAYSIQNGELATGHCKSQKIKFCPHCSRPLTDEAVEMMLERWKEALDENT